MPETPSSRSKGESVEGWTIHRLVSVVSRPGGYAHHARNPAPGLHGGR